MLVFLIFFSWMMGRRQIVKMIMLRPWGNHCLLSETTLLPTATNALWSRLITAAMYSWTEEQIPVLGALGYSVCGTGIKTANNQKLLLINTARKRNKICMQPKSSKLYWRRVKYFLVSSWWWPKANDVIFQSCCEDQCSSTLGLVLKPLDIWN